MREPTFDELYLLRTSDFLEVFFEVFAAAIFFFFLCLFFSTKKSNIFPPLYPRGRKYSSFIVRANDPLRGSSLPPFGGVGSLVESDP